MNKKICIFLACHTDSLKKYFVTLSNILYLKNHCNDIVIINSQEAKYCKNLMDEIKDFDYIKKYFQIKNDKYIDFGKWVYALYKFEYNIYDYIIFVNDSIIIMEDLDNFFHYIENLEEKINVYGYNDSTQLGKYHYQSYLFMIKTKIMNKFINLFRSKQHLIHNQESVIKHLELNLIHIDKNRDCFLKIADEYNSNKNLYWENEDLYANMVNRNLFHLFKIKKIIDCIKFYNFSIDKYVDNFDCNFYRNNYIHDLENLQDHELWDHYKGFGFNEGRNCIKKFYSILPKYYVEKLEKNKLIYLFSIPEDFDLYYYKIFNESLKNFSKNELLNHYIEYAQENENIIFQNGYNDNINKNKLFTYYVKKYYNLSIELTNDFNYCQYIKNNIRLKDNSILKNIIKFSFEKELNSNINLDTDNMEKELIRKLHKNLTNSSKEEINNFYNKNMKNNNFKDLDDVYLNYYKEKYNLTHLTDEYAKKIYKYRDSLNKNNIFYKFDPACYKLLNQEIDDLKNMDNNQLIEHYFNIGYKNNLNYEISDFNPKIYKYLYYDEFKNFSDNELMNHYILHGKKEKRKYELPVYFHLESYKKLMKLNSYNEGEIILHFINNLNDKIENKIFDLYKNMKNEKEFDKLKLIPNDFSVKLYKLLNPDLANLNNLNLKIHYLQYGIPEKRLYKLPDNFNLECYKSFNKDLKNLNNDELVIHYVNNGISENRLANLPENFNTENYKKLNPDLSNLNNNKLLNHFIKIGYNENRPYIIPKDFNPFEYKRLHKDLKNLNELELYIHYAKQGIKEERTYIIDKNFNVKQYKKFYKDASELSDEDAFYHYVNVGVKQNRIFELPRDFDLKNYKNLHFDLSFMTDNEVLDHFIHHGIQEKRQYKGYNKYYKKETVIEKKKPENNIEVKIKKNNSFNKLPDDFNVSSYRSLNSDLFYYDNDEYLINHYINIGSKENRLYKIPDDFDPLLYNRLNPDLGNLPNHKLIEHFKSFGIKEKRCYKFPNDFDYDFYRLVYLNNDNKFDKDKIRLYYLDNGIMKKHWIKLPEDFDYNIYKKLNQDLEKLSKNELIKQFVKVGHKTRIYK